MPNDRRAFRLRFRDGRSAAAPFPPSLRLRFTFPFRSQKHYWKINLVRRDQRAFLLHFTGRCSAKSPHNRAGSVPQKKRARHAVETKYAK